MPAYKRNVDRIQKKADAVLEANMAILAFVAQARTDPEMIKADALLPQGEAPMYLHIARSMGAVLAKASQGEGAAGTNRMNLVIIGQATDKTKWLEEAQRQNKLGPKPIDVKAE